MNILNDLFNKGRLVGVPTGFRVLDSLTGGLREGTLTILAATTGIGKTLFALNILIYLAKLKHNVCYFDLENGEPETWHRLLMMWFGLDRSFFMNEENALKVPAMEEDISEHMTLWFEDDLEKWEKPELKGIDLIIRLMESNVTSNNIKVYLIDPLQMMESSLSSSEAFNEQGEIVKKFKRFAQKHNVAVIICHHLRKSMTGAGQKVSDLDDVEEKDYFIPTLESLKGSSKITDTATDVWGMTRTYASENAGKTLLRILKSRSGKLGDVKLQMDMETLLFNERGNDEAYKVFDGRA